MGSQPFLHLVQADGLLPSSFGDDREIMKVFQKAPIAGER
jgi:hypothetical protein